MTDWIKIDFEGEDEIERAIERREIRAKAEARDLLDDISEAGVTMMRYTVPVYSTYLVRHVDRGPLTWSPGGLGGGGSWQRVFGVKAGTSRHPLYVNFGTGLYGAVGWYITPVRAQYLVFYGSLAKRVLRKRSVRGQRPQHFLYETWLEIQVYAQARVLRSAIH